ncbi:MAG: hypothetical protein IPM48_14330 [Saprospiraceae bacterium]|nr:hypothetical protein [Saprospiraceae bacterium]
MRFQNKIILAVFVSLVHSCSLWSAATAALQEDWMITESKLKKIWPNAQINHLNKLDGYQTAWEILVPQKVNHQDASSPIFYQRIYIDHKSLKSPNVLVTEGYQINHRIHEPSKMLDANQITIEYRYCGQSVPTKLDWTYLNHAQAMQDFYKIQNELKKIYKKKWIVTGVSKGGTTAAIYKLQYPKAVKAAMAYVAPFPLAQEDLRTIRHYRQKAGTEACRKRVFEFQKMVFSNREKLVPLIQNLAKREGVTFPLGIEKTIEYCALEYPFSFWQWGTDCEEIPGTEANALDIFHHLEEIVDINFYDSKTYEQFKPAFYQFMTEFGYYGFDTIGLSQYLLFEKQPSNLVFCPSDVDIQFNPSFMQKMEEKARTNGKKIMYVYGGLDTWTACGIEPDKRLNALRLTLADGGHRTKLRNFSAEQKSMAVQKLKKWTGIKNISTPQ